MATSENATASTTTKDSRKTPDLKHHTTDTPDTEMTVPLASTDDLVLVEKDKMFNNSFESANARHARMRGISNGQSNIKNEAEDTNRAVHQPWRRSDDSAPAYGATTSGVTSQSSGYIPQNGTGVSSAGDGSYAGQFYSPSAPSATPTIHPFPPYNPLTHGQYPNPVGYASDGVPADQVLPGPVFPTMNQLTHAWCYGMYRGNGQYTMLIPADELPEGFRIPRRQGPEGMIIAPAPRSTPPNFNNALKMVPPHVVSNFPVYDPSAPETKEPGQLPPEQLQAAIDTIVARNPQQYMSQAAPMMRSKREKEYCDKWIHEGTCAFVQQGCKYKHEMPDPNTSAGQAKLRELGLYNGLPKWYRNMLKEQEEASRVQFKSNPDFTNPPRALAPAPGRSSITPARGGNRHTGGHWREPRPVSSPTPSSSEKSTILAGRKSYGPIEPPRQGNAGPPRYSGNTFASLASLDTNMDNDDDSEEGGIKL